MAIFFLGRTSFQMHHTLTNLDVDGLPGACGAHKEARLLVFHQQVHQVGAPHCVHCGDDDGVELSILWDGRDIRECFFPQDPAAKALLYKLVVIHLPLLWERDRKWLCWRVTLFVDVELRPVSVCVCVWGGGGGGGGGG